MHRAHFFHYGTHPQRVIWKHLWSFSSWDIGGTGDGTLVPLVCQPPASPPPGTSSKMSPGLPRRQGLTCSCKCVVFQELFASFPMTHLWLTSLHCLHGQPSTGSGIPVHINPGLVNQGAWVWLWDWSGWSTHPQHPIHPKRPLPRLWMQGHKPGHLMVLGGRLSVVSSHYLMMPNTRSISFRYHISSGIFLELMEIWGKIRSRWFQADVLECVVGPGTTR